MKTFLIRGVPAAVQHDGWWMNTPPAGEGAKTLAQTKGTDAWRILLLVVLIGLGDVLIWQVIPGVSLAVFGAALLVAALWVSGRQFSGQVQGLVLGGGILVMLPLVEMVNPLSCLIGFVGVSVLLVFVAGLKPSQLARGAARLWPLGVRQTVVDVAYTAKIDGTVDVPAMLGRLVMAWFMPAILGLVFLALLLAANPVADRWIADLSLADMQIPDGARILFWLTLVPVAWTVLSLARMVERLRAAPAPAKMGPARMGLINPASVTRALLVFNVLFAVQTVMDVIYLYGGVGLPDGISYAGYAHRGAYPLVVTGLLAGGFALLTRAWVQGDALLRMLLMGFVAQNVALVISALVRLDMYVDVYGLTHLRVSAAIWMGLTAAGLILILWQVWARCDNGWLMLRGGVMTAVVLYACAWVPFDAVIAGHNLARPLKRDHQYLCRLGDAAKPLVVAHIAQTGVPFCIARELTVRVPADWREWGWRNARARSSLAALNTEVRP